MAKVFCLEKKLIITNYKTTNCFQQKVENSSCQILLFGSFNQTNYCVLQKTVVVGDFLKKELKIAVCRE